MANKASVGLVLGGGGLKAFAATALFELLERENITPQLLVGCSGGSFAAAAYGMGYRAAEIQELINQMVTKDLFRFDWRAMLGMAHVPVLGKFDYSSGIVRQEPILDMLRRFFKGADIRDLRTECRFQATDLQTGQAVVLTEGPVAEAVYASCALFPVLPPIRIGDRLLGDGWYTSPLPMLEALKGQADVIIGVVFEETVVPEAKNFLTALHNQLNILKASLTRAHTNIAIGLHHDEVLIVDMKFGQVEVWDVHELPGILETGRRIVARYRDRILEVVDRSRTHA